jgi:cryptochrome
LSPFLVYSFAMLNWLFFPEPYARERDSKITEWAKSTGIEVISEHGHTLCNPEDLVRLAGGKPTTSYGTFCNHLQKHLDANPMQLAADITQLPPISEAAEAYIAACGSSIPSLSDLGYAGAATTPFRGGETAGLAQLRRYLSKTKWVLEFQKPNTDPAIFDPAARSTTVLSPHLKVLGLLPCPRIKRTSGRVAGLPSLLTAPRGGGDARRGWQFGCVSARLFFLELRKMLEAAPAGRHTKPPVSLQGQLIWREFFYTCSAFTPNFGRMVPWPPPMSIPTPNPGLRTRCLHSPA